jgi:GT2 family glycosyltransferase
LAQSPDFLPRIGVAIVNYLNYHDTIRYIDNTLLKQEGINLTIAVVDNNSPNESYGALADRYSKDSKVFIIQNTENKGYASGNNIAIHFLETKACDLILVSNNDIEFSDRLLIKKLADEYKKVKDIAFISPLMLRNGVVNNEFCAWKLPSKSKEILNSLYLFRMIFYLYLKKYNYNINISNKEILRVDCLPGSFFMGSRDIFREMDYFDENTFLYYEETILGLKVKRKNLHNYLVQYIYYEHFDSESINLNYSTIDKYKLLLTSKIYYWKEYQSSRKGFVLLLRVFSFFNLLELILVKCFCNIFKNKF